MKEEDLTDALADDWRLQPHVMLERLMSLEAERNALADALRQADKSIPHPRSKELVSTIEGALHWKEIAENRRASCPWCHYRYGHEHDCQRPLKEQE